VNISSVIVHARPGHAVWVQQALASIEGVETHAVSPEGKLIVTIETEGDRATANTFEAISQMDHVLSAAMVYHQAEAEPDAEISVLQNKPQLQGDSK